MADVVYAFVDTNIYIHFKPLNEIPLTKIVGADIVVVVVPSIVMEELNGKKFGDNRRLKKRA